MNLQLNNGKVFSDKKMTISVIIPCYNVENYIMDCLNSVLNQTSNKLDIICIDNNSTDSTYSILKAFEKQNKISVQKQKIIGAAASRNKGLKYAKGDYIQFLDADDLLLDNKIEHQIKLAEKYNFPDLIIGSSKTINVNKTEYLNIVNKENVWNLLINVKFGNTCANLWKRSKLEEVNGWNEKLKSSQEYDLMFRMLKKNATVIFDNKPLTIIRQRKNSISTSNIEDNILRRIKHLNEIKEYLIEINYDSNVIQFANQMIFDVIRELYNYNTAKSISIYNESFNEKPIINTSSSTNSLYTKLFSIFGFTYTQKIVNQYHKAINILNK